MKVSSFLDQHPDALDGDDCDVCALHESFAKHVDATLCPKCNDETYLWVSSDTLRVVGSSNIVNDDDYINVYPVDTCPGCGAVFAWIPTPIIYNGNHDIYYTGGAHFLVDDFTMGEALIPMIQKYTDRIAHGEFLTPRDLNHWIRHVVEYTVAKYLVDHGFKQP